MASGGGDAWGRARGGLEEAAAGGVLPVMLGTHVSPSFSLPLQLLPHDTHTNNRKTYQLCLAMILVFRS
jgi:hypothetical protein